MKKGRVRTITYFSFNCPGCKHKHEIPIGGSGYDWTMTGTEENPTLEPSILNTIPVKKILDNGQETLINTEVCHLFIRSGRIEYQSDSQHELSGQIIEMTQIE